MVPNNAGVPSLPADAAALVAAVLAHDRRVLLVGAPGTGKSTLVNALAAVLADSGRTIRCLGADPGSPLFGVPGAVCLGRYARGSWAMEGLEALCTLDAGRFRLPLVWEGHAACKSTRQWGETRSDDLEGVNLLDA